jgi:hypothetical protein
MEARKEARKEARMEGWKEAIPSNVEDLPIVIVAKNKDHDHCWKYFPRPPFFLYC